MNITRVKLNAYRGLSRLDLSLQGGLTIIAGPNEAGKTTLLEFMLAVLFGAKGGGLDANAEGSLSFQFEGADYRLARSLGRARAVPTLVETAAGQPQPLSLLSAALGSLELDAYRNVFAFGLTELENLNLLDPEGVAGSLIAAGVTGGGPDAQAAAEGLRKTAGEIYKLRGRATTLNTVQGQLKTVQQALRSARATAEGYGALFASEERANSAVRTADERLRDLQARHETLGVLHRAWPSWQARLQAAQELAGLPSAPDVDDAALERLDALGGEQRACQARTADLQDELEGLQCEVETAACEVRPALEAVAPRIREARNGVQAQRERITLRAADAGAAVEADARLAASLARLGTDWTLERALAATPESWPAEIEAWATRVREQDKAAETARQLAAARQCDAEAARATLDAALQAVPGSDAVLLGAAPELTRLIGQMALHERRLLDELPRARDQEAAWERDLRERSGTLGLQPDALARLDATPAVQAQVTQAREELTRAAQAAEAKRLAEQSARAAAETAGQRAHAAAATLNGTDPAAALAAARADETRINTQLGALVALQTNFSERDRAPRVAARPNTPPWLLVAPALLALGLSVFLFMAGQVGPGAGALVIAALMTLAVVNATRATVFNGPPQASLDAVIERDARIAFDGPPPKPLTPGALTRRYQELNDAKAETVERVNVARTASSARIEAEPALTQLNAAQAELVQASAASAAASKAWTALAAGLGCPAGCAPQGALDFLAGVREAKAALGSLAEARRRRTAVEAQAKAWEAEARSVLQQAGRLAAPEVVDALRAAQAALLEAAERVRAVGGAGKALASLNGQADETARQREAQAAISERAWREASAWLNERGLEDAGRDPSVWTRALEFVNHLGSAKQAAEQARTARATLAGRAATVDDWNALVATLCRDCGLELNGRPPTEAALQTAAALDASEQASQALTTARAALEGARAKHERARGELQAVTERAQALLNTAGAGSPEEFARVAGIARRRRELNALVNQAETVLAQAAGRNAQTIAVQLDAADPQGWALELQQVEEALRQEGAARDEHLKAATNAKTERERLEGDADIPTLSQQREDLIAKAQRLARRYAVLQVAARLITSTLAEYERQHSPLVLRRAGETMNLITDGRYNRVRLQAGNDKRRVLVGAGEGGVLDATLLSRGAREQLYLALRLALAAEFAGGQARLPIIMDDVLVNADDDRAERTARAIAAAAQHTQVLYLTCHERTLDILRKADPSSQVVTLPRLPQPVALDIQDDSYPEGDDDPAGPASSGDVQALCAALSGRGWIARADILAHLPGWTGPRYNSAINAAIEARLLERAGEKRGTRYQVAAATLA